MGDSPSLEGARLALKVVNKLRYKCGKLAYLSKDCSCSITYWVFRPTGRSFVALPWIVMAPQVVLKFVIRQPTQLRRLPEKMVSLAGPTTRKACLHWSDGATCSGPNFVCGLDTSELGLHVITKQKFCYGQWLSMTCYNLYGSMA